MNTHADNEQETKSESFTNELTQIEGAVGATFQLIDSRHEAIKMQQLQELANNSALVSGIAQLQKICRKNL